MMQRVQAYSPAPEPPTRVHLLPAACATVAYAACAAAIASVVGCRSFSDVGGAHLTCLLARLATSAAASLTFRPS